jgi:hypothetical protein
MSRYDVEWFEALSSTVTRWGDTDDAGPIFGDLDRP